STPLLRDVSEYEHDALDSSLLIDDGSGAVVDRHLRAIPTDEDSVIGQPHDDTGGEDIGDRILDGLTRRLVDDRKDIDEVPAAGVGLCPAGEDLGDGIHEHDATAVIGSDDRIPDAP